MLFNNTCSLRGLWFTACAVVFLLFPAQGAPVVPFGQEQKIKITGRITDSSGMPIAGASVLEEGTTYGTATDGDGTFMLYTNPDARLEVSCIGYEKGSFPVQHRTYVALVLHEKAESIDQVIVTALGIQRNQADLTYSAEKIQGSELTAVKESNMILALGGKSAGVQVNRSASGAGASAKVNIRGIRSVASDNQPLYVVNGMPILNASPEQAYSAIGGVADAGNRDGGDGISNLNPEDIESITLLKGAPAAALYGSQAANGVILITTKKGGELHEPTVTLTSNLTVQTPFRLPEFQNRYGVSDGVESWGHGAALKDYDAANDFFRTGLTSIHSLSISTGSEQWQNYFSYANTAERGTVGRNRLMRHNFYLRTTTDMAHGRLRLDGSALFIRQTVHDKPVPGGFYMNPLVGLYRYPRGMDMTPYREGFEVYDPDRKLYVQNWIAPHEDFEQNPYWITRRIHSKSLRARTILSFSAEWKVANWLRLSARGNMDFMNDDVRQTFHASTATALAGANGRYIESSYDETLLNGELLALCNKQLGSWKLEGTVGASISDKTVNSLRLDSKTASLHYPNIFTVANIVMDGGAYIDQRIDARRQIQSVFASVSFRHKSGLNLEATGRNDWASSLAYTSHEDSGFFYCSFGASWILGETFRLPSWITFAKVRLTWSRVGNDIPIFITRPKAHISAGGGLSAADAAPGTGLEPEMTHAVEAGLEWRFLDDRLSIAATYYKTNTRNQFFKLPALSGEPYAYRYENAGNIENEGIELSLRTYPVSGRNFTWSSDVNFARNRNRVLRLHDELREFVYGPTSFSSTYAMKLVEGGSIGDIYGRAFARDPETGNILYETEGTNAGLPYTIGDGNTVRVGNANPEFTLSWINAFTFKGLTLSFMLDCRYGGRLLSQTQADLDAYGVTEATAQARDRGYVMLEGTRIDNVKGFYKLVGGRAGVTEYYLYDATNIRLRELSLSYTLPRQWVRRSRIFRDVTLSLVARNLFFLYNAAPFDPDLVLSTGNDNQGIDVYGMPTVRSVGFNLKLQF